jgi:hypothetical protein
MLPYVMKMIVCKIEHSVCCEKTNNVSGAVLKLTNRPFFLFIFVLFCTFPDLSLHFIVSCILHVSYHVVCGLCSVTLRNVFVRHDSSPRK